MKPKRKRKEHIIQPIQLQMQMVNTVAELRKFIDQFEKLSNQILKMAAQSEPKK